MLGAQAGVLGAQVGMLGAQVGVLGAQASMPFESSVSDVCVVRAFL